MEAPVDSSDSEDQSDDSMFLPEDFEDEVDINIHFHCEHCIKMSKCLERPKQGWSCEIDYCPNGCGHKFHICKTSEHRLMCSHERVPCINAGYGCPLWMQRRFIAEHLPFCPASVVLCNAEWNRWALGAKERERVAMTKGITGLYNPMDLDMALALQDQELVNEMQKVPKRVRTTLCNGITRRFPCLPLTIRGSHHHSSNENYQGNKLTHSTTEEEEDDLTPGLSVSVCTELLRGKKSVLSCPSSELRGAILPSASFTSPHSMEELSHTTHNQGDIKRKHSQSHVCKDDIAAICCSHEIIKNICMFCRNDPDEPDYKMGKVWREQLTLKKPGEFRWVVEPCVEKVRKRNQFGMYAYKRYDESDEDDDENTSLDKMNLIFDELGHPMGKRPRFQTPPPASITPKGLTMELTLKHYSRHQTKPKAMFTFQCMQDSDVVYSHSLKAFGVRPKLDYEPASCGGLPRSRSPSVEKTTSALGQMRLTPVQKGKKTGSASAKHKNINFEAATEQYLASSTHLTYLPVEVLQKIAVYLDGYSLNNLSQSCRLMRDICLSLLNERGLVIIEWVRYVEDSKVRWKEGKKRRFFSKAFEHVQHWGFKDVTHMANHLQVCDFNKRHIAEEKFAYILPRKDGTIPGIQRTNRT
ncbi:F-box only protein 30-like isoform X2 [Portunus trituberculatus]|uniref:F-box only protein 30-like isoform X2 n=1 Tax=Portunus trituberculatus TaxID=210409 RepID=UPI001E1D0050|nr:F-box only protein 30-like isoform X2 [Portunus trituberculatus]